MHIKAICLAVCFVFLAGFLSAETISNADSHDFKLSFVGLGIENGNYIYNYEIDTTKDAANNDFTVERKLIEIIVPTKDKPSLAIVEGKTIDYLNSERQTIKEKLETVSENFEPAIISDVSLEKIMHATKSTKGKNVSVEKTGLIEDFFDWLGKLVGGS